MAKALSQEERDEIAKLCGEGRSANEIARLTGRSVDTVSRIAQSIGHTFGRQNLARAQEAKSAYSAERRAVLAAKATERAEQMLAKMEGQYLVYNFGGKENTYEEHLLDEPPTEALRAMAQTFRDLMRTVLEVDRHDNRSEENLAAVDEWLRGLIHGAAQ